MPHSHTRPYGILEDRYRSRGGDRPLCGSHKKRWVMPTLQPSYSFLQLIGRLFVTLLKLVLNAPTHILHLATVSRGYTDKTRLAFSQGETSSAPSSKIATLTRTASASQYAGFKPLIFCESLLCGESSPHPSGFPTEGTGVSAALAIAKRSSGTPASERASPEGTWFV